MSDKNDLDFTIERFGDVVSSNDIVRERAAAGAHEGLVVVAQSQSGGRGRLGRCWASPPGNLYCSILLRPAVTPHRLPSLSLGVALSLAETIGPRAHVKWPNDVLIDDAKTAGILLEGGDGSVVVGIGVNVANHPTGLDYPVTSLAATGLSLTPELLLDGLLRALKINYAAWRRDGFRALRSSWLACGPKPGDVVRFRQGNRLITGRFADVDEDGALVIREADGSCRRLSGGDPVVTGS